MSDPLDDYERDGYAVFRGVLDADLVAEASDHLEWLTGRHPDRRPELFDSLTYLAEDAFFCRLVADDRLLDVAQRFVGPDLALFAAQYISKPPYDGQPVLWHHDAGYWPQLEPMTVVSLWLAVDHSTPENGCLRVIPGSHRNDLAEITRMTDQPNVLSSGMDPSLVDESRAVDVVLAPGDVSVHHPSTVHGSRANTSPERRCGLTIRYIPTTTCLNQGREWPGLFLLRGSDPAQRNSYAPWPEYAEATSIPFRGCESWNEALAGRDPLRAGAGV